MYVQDSPSGAYAGVHDTLSIYLRSARALPASVSLLHVGSSVLDTQCRLELGEFKAQHRNETELLRAGAHDEGVVREAALSHTRTRNRIRAPTTA